MKAKTIHPIYILTLLTATLIMALTPPQAISTETTTVYIDPKNGHSSFGESYTINVSVTNVTNLYTWQLRLSFNPSILNCTEVSVPPDNIFGGLIFIPSPPIIDNVIGDISALCAYATNETHGINGSGILCQIDFISKTPAITSLHLVKKGTECWGCTYLQDPNNNFIPFEPIDGTVTVESPDFSENRFDVTQNGETYPVTVFSNSTVTDLNFNQTLKVMSFMVEGPTDTKGASSVVFSKALLNGTLAVKVDSTAVYYTISENATHNFLHFTYQHSTKNVKILLTLKGDINGDRKIDMRDIYTVAKAYGSYPGHPRWNPLADLTGPDGISDGKVDMRDIYAVAKEFGRTWSP